MSAHTPGPWSFVAAENGSEEVDVKSGDWFVAVACVHPGDGDTEANARLIAAAPELLDVLRHIHAHGYDMEEYEMVRDVLAKATGEKPE